MCHFRFIFNKSKLFLGSTPHPVTVANEGLGWDSLLKMFHNPGGDWHPGWGVDLSYLPSDVFSSPLRRFNVKSFFL